tara:strand:+ start:1669 stop:2043 length:375 start_codon:yes stop_codon:yes gene_type:complete
MVDSVAAFLGWNNSAQGWGTGTWNTNVAFSVTATGSVGQAIASNASAKVTGLSATGRVGAVEAQNHVDINVTGVLATGSVSGALVYGNIVPDQNPGYTNETPSQSPAWSVEIPSQNASWTRIAA